MSRLFPKPYVPSTFTGIGTANSSAVSFFREIVDGNRHTVFLTVSGQMPAILGAPYALGLLLYTFPSACADPTKTIVMHGAYMSVGLTHVNGHVTNDTPDVGLGTLQPDQFAGLLSSVGTSAENILTGQTAANMTGTATVGTSNFNIITGESGLSMYLNMADGWSGTDSGPIAAGTVCISYEVIQSLQLNPE